jgi:hypothetical protein
MAQSLLLSAVGRSSSVIALCRLSEETACQMFCRLRWPETSGSPVYPDCGCPIVYVYRCRRLFRCKGCHLQFSVTSGTLFASHKVPF